MKAGALRQRVIVERPSRSQDETGAEVVAWTVVATVWGAVEPSTTRMRERLAASQMLADVDTVIRTRWAPIIESIDATWRLQHAGVTYNIVGIANVRARNRELEIMCVSGANDG